MAWWAAAGAALGVVGAASSFLGGNAQADEMRRQAREEDRRLKLEHGQILGETLARGAASGVEADSTSLRAYLNDMTQEFRREEAFSLSAGMRSARNQQRSSFLNAALGLGQAGYQFGAANNWWAKSSAAPSGATGATGGKF